MNSTRFAIRKDYPGGNIKVHSISDKVVSLEQEIRDTSLWWFYWNFCVEGAADLELEFRFANGEVIGPWGPAFSRDGMHWEWAGKESVIDRKTFAFDFHGLESRVYFAFCFPYQLADHQRFISRYIDRPDIREMVLSYSEQKRPLPMILAGNVRAERNILFTARHHACEAPANYVLEGILTHLLDNAANLLNDSLFHIIPFVDIDGVENGDQGKCRIPYDHNRDYIAKPIYRATSAIIDYSERTNFEIFIDFHCPWKWAESDTLDAARNEHPFFGWDFPPINKEIARFGNILKNVTVSHGRRDAIVYDPAYDIKTGDDWYTLEEMEGSSARHFAKKRTRLSTFIEIPYFGNESIKYDAKNLRLFGADMGKALELYLE
jgi:hypothetical protein